LLAIVTKHFRVLLELLLVRVNPDLTSVVMICFPYIDFVNGLNFGDYLRVDYVRLPL
jgi:hypothetical protein